MSSDKCKPGLICPELEIKNMARLTLNYWEGTNRVDYEFHDCNELTDFLKRLIVMLEKSDNYFKLIEIRYHAH